MNLRMKKCIKVTLTLITVVMVAECIQSQRNSKPRDSRNSISELVTIKPKKRQLQTNHLSWSTMLPNGRVVEETVKIIPSQKKMYIRSKKIPDGSGFSNSSTLIYFQKNHMIVKLYLKSSSGKLGEVCFLSTPDTDYDTARQEMQRRATRAIPIPSSRKYRNMVASKPVDTASLRKMGKSVFVFCRKAAAKGNVFSLVEDSHPPRSSTSKIYSPDSMTSAPTTELKASGHVSPISKSTSVPFLVKVEHYVDLIGVDRSTIKNKNT